MHYEILNDKRIEFLDKIKPFLKRYYLAGGTAIALKVGHRISKDFDLFSDKAVPRNIQKHIEKIWPLKDISVSINNSNEWSGIINGIHLSFIHYPFNLLEGLEKKDGITTPTLKELGAMKVYTIGRRAVFRDYVDLYMIIKYKNISLLEICKLAEKKYKKAFNSKLLFNQLLDMSDITEKNIEFLNKFEVKEKEIQEFFKKEIKTFFP